MKTQFIIAITFLLIISCATTKNNLKEKSQPKIETLSEDSTSYELIIFDPKFDSFLFTQPVKEFYSNEYYQTWNMQYVSEWNIRYHNPLKYGDFYETEIDYSPNVDYGIDLNYKLYNYFLFIDKEYGIKLINRAKTGN